MSESSTTDAFVKVCSATDLATDEPLRITIDGVVIVLVKTDDGSVHALNDRCSHGDISLAEGFVEDCTIECWAHGSKFDLNTGKPLTLPAFEPVAVYATEVRDGDIFINPNGTIAA